ncbi:MAG: right-handed parallel beta-helix repeat-containing protein [Kiritimatiellota bacterium]|nr:right-handed parallel beta-helix repeat-containing protein [Kiritimatiellota bacterium]
MKRNALVCIQMVVFGLCTLSVPLLADGVIKTNYYVNNQIGSDEYDGLAAEANSQAKSGPFATIMQAVKKACVGARIVVANTGKDYREGVSISGYQKGRADNPLVIEGSGATISGLVEVPAARWEFLRDDIYTFANKLSGTNYVSKAWHEKRIGNAVYGVMPNSNWLMHWRHQGWFTKPQAPEIFFLNGQPGSNVLTLAAIPAGGFFYDTQSSPRRLHFRLPAGKKLEECIIELPLNQGVFVSDDYVVVRNLRSAYSQDDGYAGFWGQGVVFQNVDGSFNCDQGISLHGTSTTLIDGGLFERNGGCGIADVGSCVTIYRNVIVRNNMIEGAFFDGLAHAMLGCRIYDNYQLQVGARGGILNLSHCVVMGDVIATNKGVGVSIGKGRLDHTTILNCRTGIAVAGGDVSVKNSVITDCDNLLSVMARATSDFSMAKSLINLGTAVFGGDVVTTTNWAAYAESHKRVSDNAVEAVVLKPPFYAVPTNSPNYTMADYGLVVGATRFTTNENWRIIP